METESGAAALSSPAPSAPAPRGSGWIVSPAFDLLFLANLAWLFALVPGYVAADGTAHLEFWQLYFLTTPHRWITLLLVAADPDRREGRTGLFLAFAVVALLLVGGAWLTTGAFTCLLLLDYVWNGWHFAAQHFGVLRMYSRKTGDDHPWLERHGLRWFIFYVIARTAGWSTGWLEDIPYGIDMLRWLDLLALCVPGVLLAAELLGRPARKTPKLVYLASVCGLYGSLLLALRGGHTVLIASLTVASATFHAVEYLAIVTHYAWRRQAAGTAGLFRTMAGQWVLVLAAYALLLGLFGMMIEKRYLVLWQGLNLWAALLHYTYDGMIWKLRRPATAQALGLDAPR